MKKFAEIECRPDDFQFFALRRSGHHAVINWLQFHYKTCEYFTNCKLKESGKVEGLTGDRFVYNNPNGKGECRILSFEDKLRNEVNPPFCAYKSLPYSKRFIVVRDIYNCFASRLKRRRNDPFWHKWPHCLDAKLWRIYFNEFLGNTNDLGERTVKVNYNFWCDNVSYREQLALEVAGHFTDEGRNIVATIGKGSSFDHLNYYNKADEMAVMDRWKEYEKDREFAPLLADKELKEICRLHFGLVF
jgi:hypothetical protein